MFAYLAHYIFIYSGILTWGTNPFHLFLSAEYKKLQQQRDTIIDYLAAQNIAALLADKLLGAGFITCPVYALAKNFAPGVVERDRVTVLFDAVLAGVKLDPSMYNTFLGILKEIEGLGAIVAVLDGK